MSDDKNRIREHRLRRAARRQGLVLSKSRRRDPRALDFGAYRLYPAASPDGTGFTFASLEEVEQYLTSKPATG